MEKLFYEIRPYAVAIIGIIALKSPAPANPALTTTLAVVLLACSGLVLYWRHDDRSSARSAERAPQRRH